LEDFGDGARGGLLLLKSAPWFASGHQSEQDGKENEGQFKKFVGKVKGVNFVGRPITKGCATLNCPSKVN